jgi:hypothetical protein
MGAARARGGRRCGALDEIGGADGVFGLEEGICLFREGLLHRAEVVQVAAHGLPCGANQALNVSGTKFFADSGQGDLCRHQNHSRLLVAK